MVLAMIWKVAVSVSEGRTVPREKELSKHSHGHDFAEAGVECPTYAELVGLGEFRAKVYSMAFLRLATAIR